MSIIKLNIPCVWGGTLTGVLMRNATIVSKQTTKIIGIHGWLDNLNSLFPLAQKLIDHHPSKSNSIEERKMMEVGLCLMNRL